jgi:hypothetical protein
MDVQLRERVQERADFRCEYCHLPSRFAYRPFHIDHVVPEKHGGETSFENLAFACNACNAYKGPNLSGIDPDSGAMTALFSPRRDKWDEHFRWDGASLRGRTPIGRTTIAVLRINESYLVALRTELIKEGVNFE